IPLRSKAVLMSPADDNMGEVSVNGAGVPDNNPSGAELETRVANGLYTLGIDMSGAKSGHATGVAVLRDGRILGGDSFFYYTGSYSFGRGKWRGEMIVHQHTDAPGLNLVFGGREVPYGFTGTDAVG